jgi:hypothetical protein
MFAWESSLQIAELSTVKTFRKKFYSPTVCAICVCLPGLPDFSWYNIPNRGKIYQITLKYLKWPQHIPNGRKIDHTTIKYTNIFHRKTLQNLPKLGFLVRKYAISQPWYLRFL